MADCCGVQDAGAPAALECPVNGARGKQVPPETLRSLLKQLPFEWPATAYYFCASPDCDVVYFPFDSAAPIFHTADVGPAIGAKLPGQDDALLCYCFGITRGQIRRDIAENHSPVIPQRIRAEVAAGRCACELRNPSGRCCLGDIAREVTAGQRAQALRPTPGAESAELAEHPRASSPLSS